MVGISAMYHTAHGRYLLHSCVNQLCNRRGWNHMKLNVLLAALPQLSFADITTIRAACDHLLSAQQYDPVDQTHPLYDEMTRLLNVGLTFRDFHNLAAYKTWKQKAPAV